MRIHARLLIKIEKILNRSISKFYNSGEVNVIATELRPTKTRPISFYKKQYFITDVNKYLKIAVPVWATVD